jgi:hypothetical protein
MRKFITIVLVILVLGVIGYFGYQAIKTRIAGTSPE